MFICCCFFFTLTTIKNITRELQNKYSSNCMCHSELLYILVILESFWYNPYVILDVKNVYKVNDLGKTSYFRVTANKLTIYMFSMVFFVFILFQHVLNTCMTTSSYSEGRVGSYFNPATFY